MNLLVMALAQGDPLAQLRDGLDTPLLERLVGLLGIAAIIGIAYLISWDRKSVNWRLVGSGLLLQGAFALIVLRSGPGRWFFQKVGDLANELLSFSTYGASIVFGNLVNSNVPVGVPTPGGVDASGGLVAQTGAFFAFNVLPTIVFFSALTTVLYYLGVLQVVVRGVAWVMQRTLRTSGAETLSASGNIFIGQTEAPLLVRPFIDKMTPSELHTVMTGGFATVAGGVMAIYILLLRDYIPSIAGHLIAASVMNAPAGLLLSKIILPETGKPVTGGSLAINVERTQSNVIDAAADGASTGAKLAINIAAMMMAFFALIALLNALISWGGGLVGLQGLSIEYIIGQAVRPLVWLMGVPWADTAYVGTLMGVKVVLTELVAYTKLASDLTGGLAAIQPRSMIIATYALLGFANLPSIAIQIGGISGLAPSRRSELSRLGLKAMIAGNLAAFMSACLAGMLA